MKSAVITFILTFVSLQSILSQLPLNGDFENWNVADSISFEEPDYWVTTNIFCSAMGTPLNATLTTDANSGNFALKLETTIDSECGPFASKAYTINSIDYSPERLTGYYKADLRGEDYSSIKISLTSNKGVIGWGVFNIEKSTLVFTPFNIPIQYIVPSEIPDSFSISIYSSLENARTGNILIVDDLAFEKETSVEIPLTEPFTTRLLPNPATDEILVEVPVEIGQVYFRIFDESGRTMEFETFENQIKIDVSQYTQGLYYYEVRLENRQLYDKGRFKVSRPKL